MERQLKSYRLSMDTVQKIEMLHDMEKQTANQYRSRVKTRTEIIEDAVAELYVMKLDQDAGSDYLSRMKLIIADAYKTQNQAMVMSLNQIIKYVLMTYEAEITTLKYLRLEEGDLPKNEEQVDALVIGTESIFEESILRKVEDILGVNE